MKKIVYFVLVIFVGLVSVLKVNAKTLTFNEVVEQFKSENYFSETGIDMDTVMKNSSFVSTNNTLTITYNYEDVTTITKFTYKDGVISYKYSGDKTSYEGVSQALMDTIWIAQLLYSVGTLQGYTQNELTTTLTTASNTIDANGVNYTLFSIEYEEEGASISGDGFETFDININEFSLKKTQDTVANPSTGFQTTLIITAVLGLLIVFGIFKKKNLFKKI